MTPFELDDCMHALKKTIAFYDKRLTDDQLGFWRAYVKKQDPEVFKRALIHYYENGKFCPKPSDIADVIAHLRVEKEARAGPRANAGPRVEPAPPHVARAWAYWINRMWETKIFSLRNSVAPDEAMEMLILVNTQAKASGNIDSIAPDWRIAGIWEEGVPEHEIRATLERQV